MIYSPSLNRNKLVQEVELRQQLEISHATVRKLEEEMGERTRQLEMARGKDLIDDQNFIFS